MYSLTQQLAQLSPVFDGENATQPGMPKSNSFSLIDFKSRKQRFKIGLNFYEENSD